MIDEKLKSAIERALAAGFRVQLKRMKDGTVKAQIIKAEELKNNTDTAAQLSARNGTMSQLTTICCRLALFIYQHCPTGR